MFFLKVFQDYSTRYWLKIGLNRTKLIFGIPTYGRGFRLLSKHLHFPYAPAIGPSSLGASVKYFEVKLKIFSLNMRILNTIQIHIREASHIREISFQI
jgi:chitinase